MLKKFFFYILGTSINAFNVIKSNAFDVGSRPVYGVSTKPIPNSEYIQNLIEWILFFIGIIIAPIIFLIGLYFFFSKKLDKKKKEKGVKYMKRSVILVVIVVLLKYLIDWGFDKYFYNM